MDKNSSVNEYDAEIMHTDMLEDICDGSQSFPIINRRDVHYKIHYWIKQKRAECKVSLLSTQKMGKGSHKVFKTIFNELSESLPIMVESGSEVSYFISEPINSAEVTRLSADTRKP